MNELTETPLVEMLKRELAEAIRDRCTAEKQFDAMRQKSAPPCSGQMMRDLCASLRENGWGFAADSLERQEADIELLTINQRALQSAIHELTEDQVRFIKLAEHGGHTLADIVLQRDGLKVENERLQLEVAVGEKLRERLREQDRTIERLRKLKDCECGWVAAKEWEERCLKAELEVKEWRDDRQEVNSKLYEENKTLTSEVERLKAEDDLWSKSSLCGTLKDRDQWQEKYEQLVRACNEAGHTGELYRQNCECPVCRTLKGTKP